MANYSNVGVLILAAGLGKRMRSSQPKVLHELCGKPMIFHILDRIKSQAPEASIGIVVGHGREQVMAAVKNEKSFASLRIHFIHQPHQGGTGHAAQCAMEDAWGKQIVKNKSPVLVLPGDCPLLPEALISQMLIPLGKAEVLRLLTTELPDPTGYGRVVRRGKSGPVIRIVEEKDANLREKAISEVACSIYLFQSAFLNFSIQKLSNQNAQGEYYLTDLIAMAARAKKRADVLKWRSADDLRGVNDPWELSEARRILNERFIRSWSLQGVKFLNPQSTWMDVTVELNEDVSIGPGCQLLGQTKIARGVTLGARVVLTDVEVGEGANLKTGTIAERSKIGAGAQIGPYAHLRPESLVGAGAKIGNFVELKKAKIGEKTSIAHLSYVGDAEIGKGVNIGCGFVTCNFDGRVIDGERKHRTIIEDDVFLGSDCQTVAPVRIGKGAYVASGSTITEDVEPEALAIARARQVNKAGYAKKLKGPTHQ